MKKSIYKIAALALVAFLLISSCNKIEDFGSTNVNPAATNDPITSALLTNVLTGIGAHASVAVPSLYCQYFSETQYPDVSCYSTNSASPMVWYSGSGTAAAPANTANLYDLENIIKANTDPATAKAAALNGANANQIAIARILKAYIYWTLTDRWGDIPYSTALKGDPNVTYDSQESIYKALISELTQAVAQFEDGAAIKGDIAYSGDIAQWQKLANSMRMLMALRLSKKYPGATDYAATEFKAALADGAGSISTNADNFTLVYPGGNYRNPYYNMYDGRKDYGESETMANLLASLADKRQSVYGATSTGAATPKGVPYGRLRAYIDPWCGNNPDYAYVLAPAFRQQTSPLYIVKASSVLLARAEAAERGWTTESTATLYAAGITASFTQWGLAAPDADYFTSTSVALGAAGTNLSKIATQQYIAYYPDGVQGWSNWRRTNVPALLPAPDATNDPKVIPRRFMYGSADATLTKAGYDEAVARLTGGDLMDSKIWWDQ
jgi:hypothetical protein